VIVNSMIPVPQMKAILIVALALSSSAYSVEPTSVADLAIAMRYDEVCSAFDKTSNDKALLLLEGVQKSGIDLSKLDIDHVSKINYGRGLVDGFYRGFSAVSNEKSACETLKKELVDKL
jgi:hypothetical protein